VLLTVVHLAMLCCRCTLKLVLLLCRMCSRAACKSLVLLLLLLWLLPQRILLLQR
jgi:hypothetical protein